MPPTYASAVPGPPDFEAGSAYPTGFDDYVRVVPQPGSALPGIVDTAAVWTLPNPGVGFAWAFKKIHWSYSDTPPAGTKLTFSWTGGTDVAYLRTPSPGFVEAGLIRVFPSNTAVTITLDAVAAILGCLFGLEAYIIPAK